jgi:hypothetical protein
MDLILNNNNNWNSFKNHCSISWIICYPIELPKFNEIVLELIKTIIKSGKETEMFIGEVDLFESTKYDNSTVLIESFLNQNTFFSRLNYYKEGVVVFEDTYSVSDVLQHKEFNFPNAPIELSGPFIYESMFYMGIRSKIDIWMPCVLSLSGINSFIDNRELSKLNSVNLNRFIRNIKKYVNKSGGDFRMDDEILECYRQFIDATICEIIIDPPLFSSIKVR